MLWSKADKPVKQGHPSATLLHCQFADSWEIGPYRSWHATETECLLVTQQQLTNTHALSLCTMATMNEAACCSSSLATLFPLSEMHTPPPVKAISLTKPYFTFRSKHKHQSQESSYDSLKPSGPLLTKCSHLLLFSITAITALQLLVYIIIRLLIPWH